MENTPVKSGDMIWVKLKGPSNEYGYGEVEKVWYEESIKDYCFLFYCLVNGGTRLGEYSKVIEKPNNRMQNKYITSRKDYNEAFREFLKR